MMVRLNIWIGVLLVVINVLLFNLVFREVRGLRVDLTEGDIYSLSPVTERILEGLDEEVVVRAFLSEPENLPEKLRPHLPELLDLLREYEERGEGKVRIEYLSPDEHTDEAEEAQNTYGIQPQAFAFRDQNQSGVKSFYFGLAVTYAGSRPETIDGPDLVERGGIFEEEPTIRLRNVEFSLTRAIKRAVYGFEGRRDVYARLDRPVVIRTFISPAAELPELFRETPDRVTKVLERMVADSKGKVSHDAVAPPAEDAQRIALSDRYGVDPLAYPGSKQPFYLWASVEFDGKLSSPFPLIGLDGALSEFQLREDFEAILRQLAPGALRTVGIVQASSPGDPMSGMRPTPARFSSLADSLRGEYAVRDLDPATLTEVPREVEVLIVPGEGRLSERAVFALDQFVMRGGRAIICADRSDVSLQPDFAITATAKDTGLEELLRAWGVTIGDRIVIDDGTRGRFFWAKRRGVGRRPEIADFTWGALPTVGFEEGTANRDVAFLSGFGAGGFWFPSALETRDVEGLKSRWLFRSTAEAWELDPAAGVAPDPEAHPDGGYARPSAAETKRRDLAVLVEGAFPSLFADRAMPATPADEEDGADPEGEKAKAPVGAPLKVSAPTRVIVVGNDDWIDDQQANLTRYYPEFGYFDYNAGFVKDAIAWMLEDDDLVQIRNRGRSFRPLARLDDDERTRVQYLNFALPLLLLALVGIGAFAARAARRPIV
ncbi:MAG: Gldg family protein [Planctomycetota bacterium]